MKMHAWFVRLSIKISRCSLYLQASVCVLACSNSKNNSDDDGAGITYSHSQHCVSLLAINAHCTSSKISMSVRLNCAKMHFKVELRWEREGVNKCMYFVCVRQRKLHSFSHAKRKRLSVSFSLSLWKRVSFDVWIRG